MHAAYPGILNTIILVKNKLTLEFPHYVVLFIDLSVKVTLKDEKESKIESNSLI